MAEEQIRFKIEKRTSYEEQMETEKKNTIINAFLCGAFGLMAIAASAAAVKSTNVSIFLTNYNLVAGILDSSIFANRLKALIESISNKTMLKDKFEDINMELEMLENEEGKGMSK